MKVRMTHKGFLDGVANVEPEDVPVWEAAGWVADFVPTVKPAVKTVSKKGNDE
jgi:hypothetical protein